LCSMAQKKRRKDFSQNYKKRRERELENIIITVKDKLSRYEKHTNTQVHAFLCLERTTDKGKGISFLISIKRKKRRKRMSRCFLDRRREWIGFYLLEFLIE
jgi:CRISPR/Cas system-associated exonuclease Cas4 (RecB family)